MRNLRNHVLLLAPTRIVRFHVRLLVKDGSASNRRHLDRRIHARLILLLLMLLRIRNLIARRRSNSLGSKTGSAIRDSRRRRIGRGSARTRSGEPWRQGSVSKLHAKRQLPSAMDSVRRDSWYDRYRHRIRRQITRFNRHVVRVPGGLIRVFG